MNSTSRRCIDPAAIRTGDLEAYVHGEASDAVAAHVHTCRACREEADAFGRLRAVLHAGLFRRSCPDSIVLGEYALDMLEPAQRTTVAAHLVECAFCRAEERSFAPFMAEDEPIAAHGIGSALKRLIAEILPAPVPLTARLRGAADGDSVTYTVRGVLQLTISVQRAGPHVNGGVVVGLVQPGATNFDGAPVALYAGDQLVRSEAIDDLGNFLFNAVPSGTYRIEVTVPSAVVVIDPLQVP